MKGAFCRGSPCMTASCVRRQRPFSTSWRRRGGSWHVSAAAVGTDASDIGALLRDSLQQRSKVEAAAPTLQAPPAPVETAPAPAPALAPESAPAPPPAPPPSFSATGKDAADAGIPYPQASAPAPAAPAPPSSLQMPEASPPPVEAPSAGVFSLDGAAGGLANDTGSAEQAMSGVTDAAADSLAAVQSAAAISTDSISTALSDAAQSSSDLHSGTTSSVLAGVSEGVSAAQGAAQGLLVSVNSATGDLQTAASGVQSSFGSSLSSAVDSIRAVAASAISSLPEPVRDALSAAGDAAQAATQQAAAAAAAAPIPATAIAAGAVAAPILIWSRRAGGYGGLVEPVGALEVLQDEDAVLIDIRDDEVRQRAGVPNLDGRALGKGVAVPLRPLPASLARSIRKADQVAAEVVAATVANLKLVRPSSTRIIVMDRGDGRAIDVAKALGTVGCRRAYVLNGGFGRWASAGLAVEVADTEYSVSPLKRIGTSTGLIARDAAGSLRNPLVGYTSAPAVALAAAAVVDWHVTLRFLGVSATLLTVAARLTSYSSPQEALDDVRGAYGRVRAAVGAPINVLTAAVQRGQRAAASVSRAASSRSEDEMQATMQPKETVGRK